MPSKFDSGVATKPREVARAKVTFIHSCFAFNADISSSFALNDSDEARLSETLLPLATETRRLLTFSADSEGESELIRRCREGEWPIDGEIIRFETCRNDASEEMGLPATLS